MSRRLRWELLALAVPVVVGMVWLGALMAGDGAAEPAPLDVVAAGPSYTTLAEMMAASDLVLVGEVRGVGDGRTITDPTDPVVGIHTRLVDVEVLQLLAGDASGTVVVEEEEALLDGTPIVVNGVAPSRVGDRGVYFLVASDDPAAPYHALVGEQGRYLLDGARLRPSGNDALSRSLAARGFDGLVAAIAGGAATGA